MNGINIHCSAFIRHVLKNPGTNIENTPSLFKNKLNPELIKKLNNIIVKWFIFGLNKLYLTWLNQSWYDQTTPSLIKLIQILSNKRKNITCCFINEINIQCSWFVTHGLENPGLNKENTFPSFKINHFRALLFAFSYFLCSFLAIWGLALREKNTANVSLYIAFSFDRSHFSVGIYYAL